MKEFRNKKLHIVKFDLDDILEKTKLLGQKSKFGRGFDYKWTRINFERCWENSLCIYYSDISITIFFKTHQMYNCKE